MQEDREFKASLKCVGNLKKAGLHETLSRRQTKENKQEDCEGFV